MSDVFPGEGWWMASDGKWYAPQLHHDPAYRARYQLPETEEVDEPVDARSEVETVESEADSTEASADVDADDVAEDEMPAGSLEGASLVSAVQGDIVASAVHGDATAGGDGGGEAQDAESVPSDADQDPTVVEPVAEPVDVATADLGVDSVPETVEEAAELAAEFPSERQAEPIGVEAEPPKAEGMPPPVVTPVENQADVPTAAEIRWPDLPTPDAGPPPSANEPQDEAASAQAPPLDADDWISHRPPETTPAPDSDTQPLSVARPRLEVPEPRPVFEPARPSSVADGHEGHHTRAKLEVGRDASRDKLVGSRVATGVVEVEPRRRSEPLSRAPSGGLTEIRIYREPTELIDRIVAGALFLAGLLMIIGTFLTWVSEPGRDVSGWERGDGVATVLAGVLGAAAAGPIFVGFRHIVPKTVAIVCGLVGSVVVGLVGLDVISDTSSAGTSLGLGFWVALIASLVMVVAAIVERTSIN